MLFAPSNALADRAAPGVNPIVQAGAYAVITDPQKRVLTIRAGNGRCYLPGGRIEAGETAREALTREIAEECGWSAAILSPVRQCMQPIMGGGVLLQASHWRARLIARLGSPPEHEATWLSPAEALACLHREADRAALQAVLRRPPHSTRLQAVTA